MNSRTATIASGVLFAVLLLAATSILQGSALPFLDSGDELAQGFADDRDAILAGAQLGVLAAAALVWLAVQLRRSFGDNGGSYGTAMIAGGTFAAAALATGLSVYASGALRAEEDGSLSPEAAATISDIGGVIIGGAAMVGMGVLVLAFGLAAARTAWRVPVWFGWVSVVLGVALFALPINYLGLFAVPVWAVIASVLLATGERASPAAAR